MTLTMVTNDPNGTPPPFIRLAGINTAAATPAEDSLVNIRASVQRGLPSLEHMEGFKVVKDPTATVALVGGGPSIKQTVHELAGFPITVACGSVHDWLVEQGVKPTFCTIADPDPVITASYLQRPCVDTTYLVATQCHASVFEALAGCRIVLWHCLNESYHAFVQEHGNPAGYPGIGGGCTVGLRSLSMFMMFGYRNIHFFGFDSCLGSYGEDEHHAYDYQHAEEMTGEVYTIKMGVDEPGERTYRVAGYHLAQASHFKDFWAEHARKFVPTFHGDGLLADLCRDVTERAKRTDALRQQQECA